MLAESFTIRAQDAHKTVAESFGICLFLKKGILNGATSLKIQLLIRKKQR
jgi:hypothetical protein